MMMMIAVSSIKSGLVPLIEVRVYALKSFILDLRLLVVCVCSSLSKAKYVQEKNRRITCESKIIKGQKEETLSSSAEIILFINKKMDCNYNVESKTWETSAYTCQLCMHLFSNEKSVFFSFLSWMANTQRNHWTKRMVRIRVITGTYDPRNYPRPLPT